MINARCAVSWKIRFPVIFLIPFFFNLSPANAQDEEPQLLSKSGNNYWQSTMVTIDGNQFSSKAGRVWLSARSDNHGRTLLIEGPADRQETSTSKISYHVHQPGANSLTKAFTYTLNFDGVLPQVALDRQGDILLLHPAESWIARGGTKIFIDGTYQLERKGWILRNGSEPAYIIGIDGLGYRLGRYPRLADMGTHETVIPMLTIELLAESPSGQVAVSGQRIDDYGDDRGVSILDSAGNITARIDEVPRLMTWSKDRLILVMKTVAKSYFRDELTTITEWGKSRRPVELLSDNGLPLLILSRSTKPSPKGWEHEDVLVLRGANLDSIVTISGPVPITKTGQTLIIGADQYWVGD